MMACVSGVSTARSSDVRSMHLPRWHRHFSRDASQVGLFILLLLLGGAAVYAGALAMPYRWQWHRVTPYLYKTFEGKAYAGPLIKGLGVTMSISAAGFVVALAAGLIAAVLLLSSSVVGRAVARAYVEMIRNTPLLVQLYLFYFVVAIFCLIWGAKASSALLNPKYPRGLLLISLTVGACCAYIFASQVDCSQTIPRERCQEIEPLLVGGFSFVCGFLGTSVVLKIFLSLLYDD